MHLTINNQDSLKKTNILATLYLLVLFPLVYTNFAISGCFLCNSPCSVFMFVPIPCYFSTSLTQPDSCLFNNVNQLTQFQDPPLNRFHVSASYHVTAILYSITTENG
jgi:hypothetical protein